MNRSWSNLDPSKKVMVYLMVGLVLVAVARNWTPERSAPPNHQAVAWTSKDGKFHGWKVVLPGNHPLATPAVVDGKVLLGGGFGSYEFYALDAATGKQIWQY